MLNDCQKKKRDTLKKLDNVPVNHVLLREAFIKKKEKKKKTFVISGFHGPACKLIDLHSFWNILHPFWNILVLSACILELSECILELSACILEHSECIL